LIRKAACRRAETPSQHHAKPLTVSPLQEHDMNKALLFAAAALVSLPVVAQTSSTTTTRSQTTASTSQLTTPVFVQMAAMSDLFEIQSSQAALQKSQDAEVKRFAQMMIDHHTKMSANLKAAVQSANVSVTIPTALTGEKAQMLQQMSALSGQQFDRMYWQAQVQGHQETLQMMRSYAQNGDNAALKQFAQQGAPVVQDHLQMAQKMMGSAKSS